VKVVWLGTQTEDPEDPGGTTKISAVLTGPAAEDIVRGAHRVLVELTAESVQYTAADAAGQEIACAIHAHHELLS
jgi:hypothetical protein